MPLSRIHHAHVLVTTITGDQKTYLYIHLYSYVYTRIYSVFDTTATASYDISLYRDI